MTFDLAEYEHRLVLPPITGGLHCGGFQGLLKLGDAPVLPPITGGLHCGTRLPAS